MKTKKYSIECAKTYNEKGIVLTSYFKGMSRVFPSLVFTSRIIDAAKYESKEKAKKVIKDFHLESKNTICSIVEVES